MTNFGPGFEELLNDLDKTVGRYNLDMKETFFVFSQVCRLLAQQQLMSGESANYELHNTLMDVDKDFGPRIRKAIEFMLLGQEVPDALYEPPDDEEPEEELVVTGIRVSFEEFKEITGIDLDQLFGPPLDPQDVN